MAHSGTIIHMRNVPGKPLHRALTVPLQYRKPDGTKGLIPAGFEWDGSSVPWLFQGFFPRHRHPIASCRHDYGCLLAKTPEERLFHDREFRKNVRKTSWKITAQAGYIGVRIGAWLGVGVYNYKARIFS
jgi:hypothetical protein